MNKRKNKAIEQTNSNVTYTGKREKDGRTERDGGRGEGRGGGEGGGM